MVFGRPAIVSRTGYTGEDGFELIVASSDGPDVWHRLIADGKEAGLMACGLGARDTLRLEAAMPLYGHELNEQVDPLTAGLSFAVKLKSGDFIGKSALESIAARGLTQGRIGLELSGRRIARRSNAVPGQSRDRPRDLGHVCPTLQKSIAMAYAQRGTAPVGQAVRSTFAASARRPLSCGCRSIIARRRDAIRERRPDRRTES